ncbi:hypothetical protein C8240_11275, partial [Paracidovorax cattleyae]
MNRLSHRTILAVSLAALWPVAPAMATAGLQHAAKMEGSQDDPPLRLAMSYSLSLPRPSRLPDLPPEPVVHAAHTLLDPRDAMARRMRLELALHGDPGAGRGPVDREADADTPRPGKADIVVDMPPPLPWWPARLYAVSNRPPPVFLPAETERPARRAEGRAERASPVHADAGTPAEPRPALRKR